MAMTASAVASAIGNAGDRSATKADLGQLATKAELGTVKAELGTVRAELGTVKADVRDIKADNKAIKAGIADLRTTSLASKGGSTARNGVWACFSAFWRRSASPSPRAFSAPSNIAAILVTNHIRLGRD